MSKSHTVPALSLLMLVLFAATAQDSHAQFEVRGTVIATSGTAVDSDVNDPNAPYAANDSFAQSQAIPALSTVGGYLNNPGAGPEGRSRADGDVVDVFRVFLPEGATATLNIAEADGAVHDLDLFLFDAGNPATLVDSSLGTELVEQVEAPYDGEFYIAALVAPDATQAAANYLLNITQGSAGTMGFSLSLGYEFIDGQAIVRFDETVPAGAHANGQAGARRPSLAERAASIGLTARAGAPGRIMLFEKAQGAGPVSALNALGKSRARSKLEACLPRDPELRKKLETLWMIKNLRRRADVTAAEPNYLRRASAIPNDVHYPDQWHYPLINLPQAWDVTTGSSETVVAVVDTGALRDHPDLQNVLPQGEDMGYDFVSSLTFSNDGDGIDPDWNDPGNAPDDFLPSSFHGSHVMGTIAAATDNSTGVAGINWRTRVMPVRGLGRWGIGSVYDIQQAVRYAAGLSNDSGTVPLQRADIINLSLGGGGPSLLEQALYSDVRAAGVIVIAAAGNDDSSTPSYPAAYDGVVSVSSVGPTKRLAPYSNFGSSIDVAAPGGDMRFDLDGDGQLDGVLSTLGQDFPVFPYIYDYLQGTSMASPHMAGVVSLMKAVNPDLTPALLDVLLRVGAITDDLGDPGRDDRYGYGLINAFKAVSAAAGPAPRPPPMLSVTPSSLDFGNDQISLPLSATNAGGGSLTITDVTENSSGWLTVEATNVDASNLGEYTVSVDRRSLADGAYSATITFDSTAGTVTVDVAMQVSEVIPGDTGFQYIRLVDAVTLNKVAEATAAADEGSYGFAFTGVPAGSYFLAAGSDSDNDGSVCEGGESCGAYPVLNELRPITVDGDVSGVEFTSRYQRFDVDDGPPVPATDIIGLPDVNGNGSPDFVVLKFDTANVVYAAFVMDGLTGVKIRRIGFDPIAPIAMAVITQSNGAPALAVLRKLDDGRSNVLVKDLATGAKVGNLFYGSEFDSIDLADAGDIDGSGAPDIAVLGVNATNKVRIQFRNLTDNAFIDNIFQGTDAEPLQLEVLPDVNGVDGPEIAVLSVRFAEGRARVWIQEIITKATVRKLTYGSTYVPGFMAYAPDAAGVGQDGIALIGTRSDTGRNRLQVLAISDGALISNAFYDNNNLPVDIDTVTDTGTDGAADLAVLFEIPDGTGRVSLSESTTGIFLRNVPLPAISSPVALTISEDINGNGKEEVAGLGDGPSSKRIDVRDANSKAGVNQIDVP